MKGGHSIDQPDEEKGSIDRCMQWECPSGGYDNNYVICKATIVGLLLMLQSVLYTFIVAFLFGQQYQYHWTTHVSETFTVTDFVY